MKGLLRNTRAVVLCSFLCGLWGAGACGSQAVSSGALVRSEFTEQDRHYFDDAVDLLADPAMLEGSWRDQWLADFGQRIERSDLIATVRIASLGTADRPDGMRFFRLQARVEERLKGAAPAPSVTLRVEPARSGSVERNRERLLRERFVVYIKWAREQGAVVAHWHLMPATKSVVGRLHKLFERRRTVHVVEH